jgi:hypothetical protein
MMELDNRFDIPREHRVRRGHFVLLSTLPGQRLMFVDMPFAMKSLVEYIRVVIRVRASIINDLAKSRARWGHSMRVPPSWPLVLSSSGNGGQ